MNIIIKHRKIVIAFVIMVSILFGILIYNKLSNEFNNLLSVDILKTNFISWKIVLFHFLILTVSFIFSFVGIGMIVLFIYLFYEGIVIGFIFSYFLSLYKLKGIIYFVSYIIVYKLLLIFLVLVLIFKYLRISKSVIRYIKTKQIDISKTTINCILIIFTIILNDFIQILIGKNLLKLFTFYLK